MSFLVTGLSVGSAWPALRRSLVISAGFADDVPCLGDNPPWIGGAATDPCGSISAVHRQPRRADLTPAQRGAFQQKMEAMRIPPFELFYEEHKGPVYGHLRRLLGEGAEDAFQETFLRALRAYPRLTNGRHLRAWVFTIATRIAIDETRRQRPRGEFTSMQRPGPYPTVFQGRPGRGPPTA